MPTTQKEVLNRADENLAVLSESIKFEYDATLGLINSKRGIRMVDNERARRNVATMKKEHVRAKAELMQAIACLKGNDEAAAVKTLAAVQNALIAHVGREKRALDEVANKNLEFKAMYTVSQAALEKILIMAVKFFKDVANGDLRGKDLDAQLTTLATALIARIAEEEKANGVYDKYIEFYVE